MLKWATELLVLGERDIARAQKLLAHIPEEADAAMARSMNRAMVHGRTVLAKSITDTYFISSSDAKEHLSILTAKPTSLRAVLFSTGKNIPLSEFKISPSLRSIKKNNRKKGVKVQVRKDRAGGTFVQAFIAQMNSGHIGIFRRADDATRRKANNTWGITTLPITEFYGTDIPGMMRTVIDEKQLELKISNRFIKELAHEVDYRLIKEAK